MYFDVHHSFTCAFAIFSPFDTTACPPHKFLAMPLLFPQSSPRKRLALFLPRGDLVFDLGLFTRFKKNLHRRTGILARLFGLTLVTLKCRFFSAESIDFSTSLKMLVYFLC